MLNYEQNSLMPNVLQSYKEFTELLTYVFHFEDPIIRRQQNMYLILKYSCLSVNEYKQARVFCTTLLCTCTTL